MLGIIDADVLVHWSARASDTPEEAVEMVHELMTEAMEMSFAEEFLVAVKGKGNFRKDVTGDYKANRKKLDEDLKLRLSAVHRTLVRDYSAVPADGMEADDQVRIWAEEARKEGKAYVIIAEDKDLRCIPGPHFNPKKREITHVTEEEADLLYHMQLLTGDSADNIKGLWRVGPVKARKALQDVPMGERMEKVIEMYKERHPEDWRDRLMECGSLIHILRTPDDAFSLPEVEENGNDSQENEEVEAQV